MTPTTHRSVAYVIYSPLTYSGAKYSSLVLGVVVFSISSVILHELPKSDSLTVP